MSLGDRVVLRLHASEPVYDCGDGTRASAGMYTIESDRQRLSRNGSGRKWTWTATTTATGTAAAACACDCVRAPMCACACVCWYLCAREWARSILEECFRMSV